MWFMDIVSKRSCDTLFLSMYVPGAGVAIRNSGGQFPPACPIRPITSPLALQATGVNEGTLGL